MGNRHTIFLNGKKVADVRDDTSRRGRIGFQAHAGAQFASMRVLVKQVARGESEALHFADIEHGGHGNG